MNTYRKLESPKKRGESDVSIVVATVPTIKYSGELETECRSINSLLMSQAGTFTPRKRGPTRECSQMLYFQQLPLSLWDYRSVLTGSCMQTLLSIYILKGFLSSEALPVTSRISQSKEGSDTSI